MSAAIAVAPSPPHERSTQNEMTTQNQPAPPPPPAPTSASPTAQKTNPPPPTRPAATGSISPKTTVPKPLSPAKNGAPASSVVVKTEQGSPRMADARRRPHRLDLSNKDHVAAGPATAIGVPGREGLGIQEVGLACLSPGFVTQDPVMKEQLQRSMTVREQQRGIIVQRLQQQQANKNLGPNPHQYYPGHHSQYPPDKTPLMSRRPKGPPGLSIVAPSHEQFAHERVIQSAPLGHSFTGRHQYDHPGRPLAPPHHPHHPPPHPHQGHPQGPPQHSARLPPIGDVFSSNNPNGTPQRPEQPPMYADGRPMPSPSLRGPEHPHGHPGHHGPPAPPGPPAPNGQPPHSARYRSAEEVQQEMARGRPDLLPKIVHYPGHQPPTPPSPVGGRTSNGSVSGKRRTRAEYEGSSPPLGHGPSSARRGPFGAGRDSPETQRQKKEEFLRLCDRAWDLFHS